MNKSRKALITAAADLFGEADFDSVSISQVAAKAGVPRGSVTNHFRSKRSLAVAVVEEMQKRWHEVYSGLDLADLGPLAALYTEATTMVNVSLSDPVMRAGYRLTQHSGIDLPFQSHYELGESRLLEYLVAASKAGEIRSDVDLHMTVRILISIIAGIGLVADRHPEEMSVSHRFIEARQVLRPYLEF